MSITPIELATMAPKSQETVSMKNAEIQKPNTDHINSNAQMETRAMQNSSITIRASQSDTPEFRYDAKEKGKNSQQYQSGSEHQGAHQEDKNKRETEEEKKLGRGIDIRI